MEFLKSKKKETSKKRRDLLCPRAQRSGGRGKDETFIFDVSVLISIVRVSFLFFFFPLF